MGKRLIQQARGKGSPTYRSPSFKFKTDGKLKRLKPELIEGTIIDFVNCPGHTAPMAEVEYVDGEICLMPAPEGVKVGDKVAAGPGAKPAPGSIAPLRDLPEGTTIFNIESQPGDGGKFCRTSGVSARIVSKTEKNAIVLLPSKKQRSFNLTCRATVGVIAGGGRPEKPFLKAGVVYHKKRAKNKLYPRTSACKMNAVDHPFGNKRSSRKAKQKVVSRFAPPGKKVGKIASRRTGKRK